MKIRNKTDWLTRSLRQIITPILQQETWVEERKKILVKIVFSSRSEEIYCNARKGYMIKLWLPRVGKIDPTDLAAKFRRGVDIWSGISAKNMSTERRLNAYAAEGQMFSSVYLERKTPAQIVMKETTSEKLAHAKGLLAEAETRMSRAITIQKKWKAKIARLERLAQEELTSVPTSVNQKAERKIRFLAPTQKES